ncbi:hypothetical protein Rsub_06885 [Raphidocelis subcapitata]|uniref:cyclic pyranopterin monophosphate synthase n=1 Tax=Raphidocelis subcapitata TaxID=307507 RepID=A0A2V0P1Y6_9CHLO|nr:hypothetical protein Rsub_06885 [Raphidocelis subcapitata]|eukprot:GBF93886.1 hypothetical protein Rsub_06885 [Raphidocelis subcapitata]
MAGLLLAARTALSGAAGAGFLRAALPPSARALSTTGNPEVDALNRELDEFFGVRNAAGSSAFAPQPGDGAPQLHAAPAAPPGNASWEPDAASGGSSGSSSGSTGFPQVESALSALSQQLAELRAQLHAGGTPPGTPPQAAAFAGPQPGAASGSSGGSYSSSELRGPPSSSSGSGDGLTHVDGSGRAAMVDVSAKAATAREARASCRVLVGRQAFDLVQSNSLKKGDVLTVAQLAGITGAKLTSQLIPLCHTLLLSKVDVSLSLDAPAHAVVVRSRAVTVGQTGVEMEALTAAAVAALTVYDMVKAVTKDACVTDLRLDFKSGGKSGTYDRGAGA